jgi:hypothetical protein
VAMAALNACSGSWPSMPTVSRRKSNSGSAWRDGRISFIHDYRYVRYVTADAEVTLAPEAKAVDNGVAQ